MDYKGYNIAVHELGHNVEQTFSLNFVDHTLLAGVPNTAFTEAIAFVFQERDLDAPRPREGGREGPRARDAQHVLGDGGDRRASPSSTWPSGSGCTTTPRRRPPS